MSYHQNEQGRVAALRRGDLPAPNATAPRSTTHRRPGSERPDGHGDRPASRSGTTPFSSCPAIGVGLYRVTDSTIMHNRIDWCVRGYSHGLLQPRPGLRRAADVRAEQPQHRRLQLDHARRRRPVPLGRAVHDGHGSGRRQRQRVLRQRFQPRADQRDRGHLQPQHLRRATASRSAGTASGAATASIRCGAAIGSRATSKGWRSSTARTTSSRATRSTAMRRRSGCGRTRRRIRAGATPKARDTRSHDYRIERQHLPRQQDGARHPEHGRRAR